MEREIEKRSILSLRDHPRQQELFGDVSGAEIEELARSIDKEGQREPVHILPDGTILAGHQRVRAARRLDWTEIDVIVRHDLANAGEQAIVTFLIEDNLIRRHLDVIAIGRLYRALREIERDEPYEELAPQDHRELRDRLAARLPANISGRTLDRYARLLDLPVEVQQAVSSGALPMSDALMVADASEQVQQEIVEQIQAGRPAKQVIRERVRPRSRLIRSPHGVYRDFLRHLDRTIDLLAESLDEIAGTGLPAEQTLRILDKSERFLSLLREREAEAARQPEGDGNDADDG